MDSRNERLHVSSCAHNEHDDGQTRDEQITQGSRRALIDRTDVIVATMVSLWILGDVVCVIRDGEMGMKREGRLHATHDQCMLVASHWIRVHQPLWKFDRCLRHVQRIREYSNGIEPDDDVDRRGDRIVRGLVER